MRLYLAIILAISFLENFEVHIIRGTLGSQALAHSSCVSLRTKEIGIRRLSDYEIHQHPQKVVILIAKNRVKICVPHDAAWVKKVIRNLDKRKQKTSDLINIHRSNNVTNRTTI
ncbi:cytokine SCM-1 beta-like [Pseudonaja textilis]|uniref:cytokine SCM-1 beta-like n=1 Tax=Pseudonaja textilis TaxID=8673 RepID=UPI000EA83C2B|nr:cytokine SCM-1 beta-like [Pseudonaja textilis]